MKRLLLFLALLCCIASVSALPTTGAATAVSSNNATLHAAGATTPCWFVWGQQSDGETWKTPNQTAVAGVCTYTVKGSPLLGNTLFYFKACDSTGCGNELSFTTLTVTPIPTTTYGATFDNLTESGMDLTLVGINAVAPYSWLIPDFAALVWGVMFGFIFIGMWLRGRDMLTPTVTGIIIGGFIFFGGQGLNLGLPTQFVDLAQGLTYASIAGTVLIIIKK